MTLRTEYGSLMRDLSPAETALVRRMGYRGVADKDFKRFFLAMLSESQGNGDPHDLSLNEDELEVMGYFLKHPEERERVMDRYPPRTQAYPLYAALFDHYLLRNDGRSKRTTFYAGPKQAEPARFGARAI